MRRGRLAPERGVAVLTVLLVMILLMALAAGAVLATITETQVAALHGDRMGAVHAAETAARLVLLELGSLADWTPVLAGTLRSRHVDGASSGLRVLPDGRDLDLAAETSLMRCGRRTGCTVRRMNAVTAARPWGRNNPRWQPYLHAPLDHLLGAPAPRFYVVAWVADDPAEVDADPLRDGTGAGEGRVLVRARSYGPRRARATVEILAAREPAGPGPFAVLSWREFR